MNKRDIFLIIVLVFLLAAGGFYISLQVMPYGTIEPAHVNVHIASTQTPSDGQNTANDTMRASPTEMSLVEIDPVYPSGNAADVAVKLAKKYEGTTLSINYEAGLQAMDGHFFGAEWTKLTGINVEIIEHGFEELHDLTLEQADKLDVINFVPAWEGDFVTAGILAPIDDFIEQHYPADELAGLHPTYRNNWLVGDVIYGIPDDGDIQILYYRRDLFNDPENQAGFQSRYGYGLNPPETWDQWLDICAFFTKKYAPEIYGCGLQHTGHAYYWFQALFRSQGGVFFDPETMEARVNSGSAVRAVEIILESLAYEPIAAKNWDFSDNFGAWLQGRTAMTISWPGVGRWSEEYGREYEQLAWLPETTVAEKVGYAPQPGGGELAMGFKLGVSAYSENQEAAYLFIQWLNSEKISLQRAMTPFSLRDPYRLSHYESELYRAQWAYAGEYLDTLNQAAKSGFLDLMIPGSHEYEDAEQRALTVLLEGADIQKTLDLLAAEWNEITENYGVEEQRAAYSEWLKLPNAY